MLKRATEAGVFAASYEARPHLLPRAETLNPLSASLINKRDEADEGQQYKSCGDIGLCRRKYSHQSCGEAAAAVPEEVGRLIIVDHLSRNSVTDCECVHALKWVFRYM